MNGFKKLISWIKNIFHKKEKIVMIEEPKEQSTKNNESRFIESIKVNIAEKKSKKVQTPICEGDGLGIQKKLSY